MDLPSASPSQFPAGTVSWVELFANEGCVAASRFYCGLFNWQVVTSQRLLDSDSGFWNLQQDGRNVGGVAAEIYATAPGVPQRSHWIPDVTVADADATGRRILNLGGRALLPPREMTGSPDPKRAAHNTGRLGIFADPWGAEFAVWQPRSVHGFDRFGEPNSYAWSELRCHDPQAATDFYSAVFGWECRADDFYVPDVANCVAGLTRVAEDIRPEWLVYFAVADVDAMAAKATRLGGAVAEAPVDIPGKGRVASLTDSQGAAFAVVQR